MAARPKPWKADGVTVRDADGRAIVVTVGPRVADGAEITGEIILAVNLHDELMAAVRAARHYVNEAAQDPLNVPAANKLDAQLASVLKKAEEHT